MKLSLKQAFRNRRQLIDALALFFGIGAMLGSSSIFVQLPLLINNAPEGWRLPTFMAAVSEMGNIGAILYTIYMKYTSRTRDHLLIYGLLGGGTAAMFCLVFLYQETSYIFGTELSTGVLGFSFVISLVSCTSSVLFIPYMRNFRKIYMVSYLVGEGLSGLLPSVLALIQGVGGNPQCVNATDPNSETPFVEYYPDPNFSTSVFFAIIGVIIFVSFIASVALSRIPADSTERVNLPNETKASPSGAELSTTCETEESEWKMSRKTYIYLMTIIWLLAALEYGVLPTIQSYSCLPYGNVTYHLAVTLGLMAYPIAMSIGFFVIKPRVDVISYLTAVVICLLAFTSYLAVMSPAPPLQHTWIGEFIIIVTWVAIFGLIGFARLSSMTLFQPDPGSGLFHTGVATLAGSLSGSVLSFCLVNFTGIFVSYSPCDNYLSVAFT